ncbi:MAG: tetratricopeptide repeat protein [Leptolyngbya sp. SIOISBB]|nr:tetratricopeptide repeat protein [Leptolyngbya sp. SIOISBB]
MIADSVVAPYVSPQCLPESAREMRQRVQRAMQQGDYPRAIAILNMLIVRQGAQAEDFNNRGLVHLWNGELHKAIRDFDHALALNPELPAVYNNRANYYAALGDLESALADYDRTIDLNPFHVRARINRGVTLRELGSYDAALESFDDALLFNQFAGEAYAERGRTYHLRGDWNCAIADYRRSLQQWANTSEEMTLTVDSCRYRVMGWISEFSIAA